MINDRTSLETLPQWKWLFTHKFFTRCSPTLLSNSPSLTSHKLYNYYTRQLTFRHTITLHFHEPQIHHVHAMLSHSLTTLEPYSHTHHSLTYSTLTLTITHHSLTVLPHSPLTYIQYSHTYHHSPLTNCTLTLTTHLHTVLSHPPSLTTY